MDNSKFKFIVRIRDYLDPSSENGNSFSPLKESQDKGHRSPSSKRMILQQRIENFISKQSEMSKFKTSDRNNYTLFTSVEFSNFVVTSNNGLSEKYIKNNFISKEDILKQSSNLTVFEFDNVYDEKHEVKKIYSDNIKENVNDLLRGKCMCIILLGPSNSGKSLVSRGSRDEIGIIECSSIDIFNQITRENKKGRVLNIFLSVSCIYQESINDLLSQNKHYNMKEEDINEREIKSTTDIFNIINEAIKRRRNLEESLKIKDFSKKSHFLISLRIKLNNSFLSQIDLLELASSEYLFSDGNDNLDDNSLNSLRNIIISISKNDFINNGACKITKCLKNTLNAESKLIFINCVIPNEDPFSSSFKVLKYTKSLQEKILFESSKDQLSRQIDIGRNTIYEDENIIRTEGDEEVSLKDKNNSFKINKCSINSSKDDSLIPKDINNKNDNKITELEKHVQNLTLRSKEINQTLESLRKEKIEVKQLTREPNNLIEKLKNEILILKSDNIIFREEINKLSEMNRHFEQELVSQRDRNLELAAEVEKLFQEKVKMDHEMQKMTYDVIKLNKSDNQLNEINNLRFQMDMKIKELEIENKNLKNEKQKHEIDFKVFMDKFNEIYKKNEFESRELIFLKVKQSEDINLFEKNLDRMTKDVECLQREKSKLESHLEILKQDLLICEKQRDHFRDKFHDYKARNNVMNSKLSEIETEFKTILNEKDNESQFIMEKKTEESLKKKEKLDTKQKLFEEMQSRIINFKTDFLKKRYVDKNN